VDLIPNGRNIEVTDENKTDYVRKLCCMLMKGGILKQIQSFLAGFHELIPLDLIKFFDCQELELMITGLSEIDIKDLQQNSEYYNYSMNSEIIKWFWEVLEEFSFSEKASFIQFVTGCDLLSFC